jgi:hypothetical protein
LTTRDANRLTEVQLHHNRITRNDWEAFAPHRAQVTELLIQAASFDRATLCVLGAGNGNDIDLSSLLLRFRKITLVDLDPDALKHCVAKVPADSAAKIETIAGVDLSGILSLLDSPSEQPLSSRQINQAVARTRELRPKAGLGQYDVVASTCLLTQIIDSVVERVGPDHPRFADLVLAMRDSHLKLISDLTASPGTGLLITDFVSSDTLPQLSSATDQQLESLLGHAIGQGNFFTGVNPGVLAKRFGDQSICGGRSSIQLYPPWRWKMGNRSYAVCAVAMAKHVFT